MKKKFTGALIILALIMSFAAAAVAAPASVNGASTAKYYPMEAVKEYEDKANIAVYGETGEGGMGRNPALNALAAGKVDVVLSTLPLSTIMTMETPAKMPGTKVAENLAAAAEQGYSFSEIAHLIDPIGIIVNANNPIESISMKELKKVYNGEITTWGQLGVKGEWEQAPVEVYGTTLEDCKRTTLNELFGTKQSKAINTVENTLYKGVEKHTEGAKIKDIYGKNMSFMAEEAYKYGIGYDSTHFIYSKEADDESELKYEARRSGFKEIPVTYDADDKTGPGADYTFNSKNYPFSRYLYTITRNDVRDDAAKFVKYFRMAETQKKFADYGTNYDVNQMPLPTDVVKGSGSDVAQFFPKAALKNYDGKATINGGMSPYYEMDKGKFAQLKWNKNTGIRALAEGYLDIAFSTWSREAIDLEGTKKVREAIEKAENEGTEFIFTPFIIDAITPVINAENPVKSLSLQQLKDIYSGKITDWNQIDASIEKGSTINVFKTDDSDGKYIIWKDIVGDTEGVGTIAPKDVSEPIAADKWAIGYDSMHYVREYPAFTDEKVKILTVTNAEELHAGPSEEYPVSRYLYAVTRDNDTTEETNTFLTYLLSDEAQEKAEEVGQVKLPKEEPYKDNSGCNTGIAGIILLAFIPMAAKKRK